MTDTVYIGFSKPMPMIVYEFRIYCMTEHSYVRCIDTKVPKTCPNNSEHDIDSSKTYALSDVFNSNKTAMINGEEIKIKCDIESISEEIALMKKDNEILKMENNKFKLEMEEIKAMFYYQPDGKGTEEAKQHFNDLSHIQKN